MKNAFVAREHGFNVGPNGAPFRYAILDIGADLVSTNGAMVSPYVRYSNSYGRGVDFPRDYGSELGFGFVILP